jgi:hypothetical protein
LRHLVTIHTYRQVIPHTIVEIGPGDSLGTGIAALLTGTEQYIALDVIKYGDATNNVKIFDELVLLFRKRTPMAGDTVYPNLIPKLTDHRFPKNILTDELLDRSMHDARLELIRKELQFPSLSNKFIRHFVPWQAADVAKESADLVISQSVLQYTKLEEVYDTMHGWLKPGGLMSHVIDFSSLGISNTWNGHWAYTAWEWRLFKFGKKILLNRSYLGLHKEYIRQFSFELLTVMSYKNENGLPVDQLAKEFKHLDEEDIKTYAAYILAAKRS